MLADGVLLPVRFSTWAWGVGMNKEIFVSKKVGTYLDLLEGTSMLTLSRHT